MDYSEAPFHRALTEGPPGGRAFWLSSDDGLRLRIGLWPGGGRGTVILLPGRTEYIEKYGRAALALVARGWSVISLDFRGQGLSQRLHPDPMLGHVGRFQDYQRDLAALMTFLESEGAGYGLPRPFLMMAHSMGGLIGLEALGSGLLPVRAAVFSAPMWGVRIPLWRQPMAAFLRRLPLALPQDQNYAPTTSARSYVLSAGFEANHLTGCAEHWSWLQGHLRAEPGFSLGGPSLGWLRSALRSCEAAMRRPAPDLPALIALGSEDHIVLAAPIRRRVASWPGARLEIYEGGRHEIPLERAVHRERFFESADQLFGEAAGGEAAGGEAAGGEAGG